MLIGRHPVFISSNMTVRYFTREEANEVLTQLKPLMAQLLERRAKATRTSRQIEHLLEQPHIDIGGPITTELSQDFVIIENLLSQIRSYGCVVKNLEAGLVDFLAQLSSASLSPGFRDDVEPAVRAEVERMDPVVVLGSVDLGEHQLLAPRVGHAVPIAIVEGEDIIARRDDHAIAEHADPVGGIDIGALVENRGFVGLAILVVYFRNRGSIAVEDINSLKG